MPATPVRANGAVGSAQPVITTSVTGDWVTIHSDLEASAESAGNLLNPTSATVNSNVVPIKVGNAVSKVVLRVRYDQGATVTTSPVVRFYGAYCSDAVAHTIESTGVIPTGGTCEFVRLDNADSGAAGVTLTLDATNDLRDSTYKYSDPISLTPMDLLGCRYLVALVSTAANTSTGAVVLRALLLN